MGRITDINCLPIQNAVVSIWHANSRGVNHYDKNIEDDLNFAGSGRFVVNNLGYYNFITIAPGKIGDRAPHINFLVQHPDFPEFTTQMFLLTIIAIIALILFLKILLVMGLQAFS